MYLVIWICFSNVAPFVMHLCSFVGVTCLLVIARYCHKFLILNKNVERQIHKLLVAMCERVPHCFWIYLFVGTRGGFKG